MKWGAVAMCAILALSLVGFGLQTYQLVSELFPRDSEVMRYFAVGSLDGAGIIFLVLDMFWAFRVPDHRTLVNGMYKICFAGSGLATFCQILFFDAIRINASIPTPLLTFVYIVIAVLTTVDVYVLVTIVHGHYSVTTFNDVLVTQEKKSLAQLTKSSESR